MTSLANAEQALAECEERVARLESLEVVARLTTGLSHEFNNLLQTVVGGLHVVQKLIDTGRVAETDRFTHSAVQAAQNAVAMNQRLVRLARPHPFSPKPFAANEFLDDLAATLRQALPRSITLRSDLAPELWSACCDAHQCELCLLGLAFRTSDTMDGAGAINVVTRNETFEPQEDRRSALSAGRYVSIQLSDARFEATDDAAWTPLHTGRSDDGAWSNRSGHPAVLRFAQQNRGGVRYSHPSSPAAAMIYLPCSSDEASGAEPHR